MFLVKVDLSYCLKVFSNHNAFLWNFKTLLKQINIRFIRVIVLFLLFSCMYGLCRVVHEEIESSKFTLNSKSVTYSNQFISEEKSTVLHSRVKKKKHFLKSIWDHFFSYDEISYLQRSFRLQKIVQRVAWITHAQFPLLLMSYISMVHLSQLMNEYWFITTYVYTGFKFFPRVLSLFHNTIRDTFSCHDSLRSSELTVS